MILPIQIGFNRLGLFRWEWWARYEGGYTMSLGGFWFRRTAAKSQRYWQTRYWPGMYP